MVARELPKLEARVRFPSPAPMINFAEIIAHRLRERGLDAAWSDSEQIRVVWSDGHMTFTIDSGKIHCWEGEYDLYENRPIEKFIETVIECGSRMSCSDCPIRKE